MAERRLRIVMKSSAEAGLLRAFVRLHDAPTANAAVWRVVEDGPHDAVVTDDVFTVFSNQPHLRVVNQRPEGAGADAYLVRPFGADSFYKWLGEVGSVAPAAVTTKPSVPAPSLAMPKSPTPAAPAPARVPAAVQAQLARALPTRVASEEAEVSPLAALMATRQMAASVVSQPLSKPEPSPVFATADAQAPAVQIDPTVSYRLVRWPPSTITRNDPLRVRMATFLSKRAMTTAELAKVCASAVSACDNFLRVLLSVGLAQAMPRAAAPASASVPAVSLPIVGTVPTFKNQVQASRTVAMPGGDDDKRRGLVLNIRRRLGLS